MIDTIMLFAAGSGTRMRHLSENQPKCLIPILGKPILYYIFELISYQYNFKRIVINTHYLHEQVTQYVHDLQKQHNINAEIIVIHEQELLETGGTIKNIINILNSPAIFTINSDIIIKPSANIFEYMLSQWSPESMDFLLLMQSCDQAIGYKGSGDFEISSDKKLHRPDKLDGYSYMYAGISILKPNLIASNPLKIFSLRDYYINSSKAFGVTAPFDTRWYHATAPEDIVDIEFDLFNMSKNG